MIAETNGVYISHSWHCIVTCISDVFVKSLFRRLVIVDMEGHALLILAYVHKGTEEKVTLKAGNLRWSHVGLREMFFNYPGRTAMEAMPSRSKVVVHCVAPL